MNSKIKIQELRNTIHQQLKPLVGDKCIILDAPYYHNIGDILIWEGEKQFLVDNKIECIYTASYETCIFPTIDKEVTILFNGGGNLGDIYHEHAEFLIKITKEYPNNKIIICPQTVHYENKTLEEKDFSALQEHKNLYFCARDKNVYQLVKAYLGNKTLLVPDMAFCISEERLSPYMLNTTLGKLIIDRNDCEKEDNISISKDGIISDWPVFEHSIRTTTFLNKIFKRIADAKIPILSSLNNKLWDLYVQKCFCNLMVSEGVRFISPFRIVETTRLHGCILSILLGKEVILIDNSYGKNRNFYDTWLHDLDSINLK